MELGYLNAYQPAIGEHFASLHPLYGSHAGNKPLPHGRHAKCARYVALSHPTPDVPLLAGIRAGYLYTGPFAHSCRCMCIQLHAASFPPRRVASTGGNVQSLASGGFVRAAQPPRNEAWVSIEHMLEAEILDCAAPMPAPKLHRRYLIPSRDSLIPRCTLKSPEAADGRPLPRERPKIERGSALRICTTFTVMWRLCNALSRVFETLRETNGAGLDVGSLPKHAGEGHARDRKGIAPDSSE